MLIPLCFPQTEYHLGTLKAKLAKYRRELLEVPAKKGGGEGFDVMKSGGWFHEGVRILAKG
jgi:ribosome-interacting GTPase 1